MLDIKEIIDIYSSKNCVILRTFIINNNNQNQFKYKESEHKEQ